MKKKSLKAILFSALVLVTSSNILCAAQSAEVDVSKLIGVTIPALSETKTGDLIGWHNKGGGFLRSSDEGLAMSEYYRDNLAIFIITRFDKKKNQTILDAKKLPMNIMDYRIVGERIVFRGDTRLFRLATHCQSPAFPESILIALARAEKGFETCSHWTRKIKLAWVLDIRTGKLKDISTKSVACHLDDYADSCN